MVACVLLAGCYDSTMGGPVPAGALRALAWASFSPAEVHVDESGAYTYLSDRAPIACRGSLTGDLEQRWRALVRSYTPHEDHYSLHCGQAWFQAEGEEARAPVDCGPSWRYFEFVSDVAALGAECETLSGDWTFYVSADVASVEEDVYAVGWFGLSPGRVTWWEEPHVEPHECEVSSLDAETLSRVGTRVIRGLEHEEGPREWAVTELRRVGDFTVRQTNPSLSIHGEYGWRSHSLYTLGDAIDPLLEVALRNCDWEPIF